MKQLIYSGKIVEAHARYWRERIRPELEKSLVAEVVTDPDMLKPHRTFIGCCIENCETLAVGKPDALARQANQLRVLLDKTIQACPEENPIFRTKATRQYVESLLVLFGYKTFVARFPKKRDLQEVHASGLWEALYSEQSWSAYAFVVASGLRVCPYCNRQYITPLILTDDRGKPVAHMRGDLDHFYPKARYPFLSMSLYNMIPCCKFCNSSLKGRKEFSDTTLHPCDGDIDGHFRFVSDFAQAPQMPSVQIDRIDSASGKNADDYIDTFQLEAQYAFHRNQVKELMDKRQIYPDSYIRELFFQNPSLFPSIQSVVEEVIGFFPDASNLNDEVLAKFRRDIALQLGFHAFALPREELNAKKEALLRSME